MLVLVVYVYIVPPRDLVISVSMLVLAVYVYIVPLRDLVMSVSMLVLGVYVYLLPPRPFNSVPLVCLFLYVSAYSLGKYIFTVVAI